MNEAAVTAHPPQSPARIFWRHFRRNPTALTGAALLVFLYGAATLAPFVAPYPEDEMDRVVYESRLIDPARQIYREDRERPVPLRFLVRGAPYRLLGVLPTDRHLFGADAPARVNLLGTDAAGRDELSRLLFGGQVSLTVGLVGIAISFTLGLLLGGVSGYVGGWLDALIMRFGELLLTIPGLYLLLALRAAIPLDLPSRQVYLTIVAILGLIGWAALARVIRGLVLSIRRQDYVTAAEALGMGRWRILVRHILPNTASFVIVAATVSVPGYILGEVVLSFLGVGVQEPAASWGNMLTQPARSLSVMTAFPWLVYAPGLAIFLTVMAFNLFGDGLRDALDPRQIGATLPR